MRCQLHNHTTHGEPPRSTLHLFLAVQFTSNSLRFVQSSRGRRSFKKEFFEEAYVIPIGRGGLSEVDRTHIFAWRQDEYFALSPPVSEKKAAKGRETDLSVFPQRNKACLARN